MKKADHNVSELINDEYFLKWLIDPDKSCIEFWENWMNEEPQRVRDVEEAKKIILSISFTENNISETGKKELWMSISDSVENQRRPHKSQPGKVIPWYKIAAVFLLLSIYPAKLYFFQSGPEGVIKTEYAKKFVQPGQKLTVHLDDGTIVKLNSGSKITYPEKFSKDTRKVFLEGEAFFQVERDPNKPFIVITKDLMTTVLGTSFNLKAYLEQNQVQVAVVTGKVMVKNSFPDSQSQNSLLVGPKDMATYDRNQKTMYKTSFAPEEITAWKDGIIYFKNADFNEIRETLEKWYGVSFSVNKKIDIEEDFTGTFDNKSLDTVLKGLGFAFDFRYKIDGSTVSIR